MAQLDMGAVLQNLTYVEWIQGFIKLWDPAAREFIPFQPWEGQREMLEWLEGRRESWAPKARQLGLSEIGASILLKKALEKPRGQYVVISKNIDDASYFLQNRVLPKYENLPRGPFTWPERTGRPNALKLEFSNGSSITSLPAANASAAGRTLNGVIFDEAGGIDKTPNASFSQIYKNTMPTIEKAGGDAFALIIGTSEPGSFFNTQLFKQWKGEVDPMYYFLNWRTDPNRDEAWYHREMQKQETLADFQNQFPTNMSEFFATREGRVFPSFDPNTGGKHIYDFEPDWTQEQYMVGYDHGFKHKAAMLHFSYNPYDDMLSVMSEQFWKATDVYAIASDARARMEEVGRIPAAQIADTQIFNEDGRRSVHRHFRDEGIEFRPARKFDEAGSRGLVSERFTKCLIRIHPSCANTITQLMGYVWKSGGNGEKPVDREDEAPDILRYICSHISRQDRPGAEQPRKREPYSGKNRRYESRSEMPKHWQAL